MQICHKFYMWTFPNLSIIYTAICQMSTAALFQTHMQVVRWQTGQFLKDKSREPAGHFNFLFLNYWDLYTHNCAVAVIKCLQAKQYFKINFNSLKHSYGLRGLTRLMAIPVLYGPVTECRYLEVSTETSLFPSSHIWQQCCHCNVLVSVAAAGHLLSTFCDKEAVHATQ